MGLSEQIDALPPELKQEVADFVGYLLQKRSQQNKQEAVNRSLAAAEAFHGLGADTWAGTDPDQYVQELRADW